MRIALATVGTTGDVVPFAWLARTLAARGHQVSAISWPMHRAALSLPGVSFEPAGPHADPSALEAVAATAASAGPMQQVEVLRDFHLADAVAHYRRLRDLLPGHDIVVLHGIHALAHSAALDTGLPWASVAFDPVLLPTRSAPPPGMPNLGPANRLLWAVLNRALARIARPLDEALRGAGSGQRNLPLFRARSPRLHLVGCSPALMNVPPDLPAGTSITGAWLDPSPIRRLPEALAAFLDAGPPPVVVTFGSMASPDSVELADAFDRLLTAGHRIVTQAPVPAALASPNLLRVGAVDHRALFARAAVVVHHGGAGTTHAVGRAGVASVVIPMVGDQRYWADRLARLSAAPTPLDHKDLSPASLAEAVTSTLANQSMRRAAQRLAEALAREDGIGRAVALVEAAV